MSDQPPDGTDPDLPGANTPGGKARATDMPYHDEKRLGDETPFYRRWALPLALILAVAAVGLLFLLLTGDDDGSSTTSSTTSPPTTATTSTATTVPLTTVVDVLEPGEACSPEDQEVEPDCIDPEDDGSRVYLPGGVDCLAEATDPLDCADNDGDGAPGPPLNND